MLKIALVVNEPPPYRIPIFNLIAAAPRIRLLVIFCCRREPNRHWDLPPFEFDHVFLRERIRTVNGRYIHNNPDVWLALSRFDPDVVVTNGFNPTHLYALMWTRLKAKYLVTMTDGTLSSEQLLSPLHHRIRRFAYARSAAFIAASNGGLALYQSYGVEGERCFKSCLCIDNTRFMPSEEQDAKEDAELEKPFDFIFCSRMEPAKNPIFALKVALQASRLLGRQTSILFVGSGSEEDACKSMAKQMATEVDAQFHGFASQASLPALYRSARVFLFPSSADVWGVVANEACAAGLPVMVTPHAGVAGELVMDSKNGYVCPLDVTAWANRATALLEDKALLRRFGESSLELVSQYTFSKAAQGIIDACQLAFRSKINYAAVRRPL